MLPSLLSCSIALTVIPIVCFIQQIPLHGCSTFCARINVLHIFDPVLLVIIHALIAKDFSIVVKIMDILYSDESLTF